MRIRIQGTGLQQGVPLGRSETQNFLLEHEIPNRLYPGVGHWHMVENAPPLYGDFLEILQD
ncbi:MAG TPA: hypothetical protein DCE41_20250 [Cytophagales bacterium]|nr:hypothetical protein [Cytophagales bacterium]HAA20640.1 hypothetical protein [Cytophagales bacterium]HAP61545.1 hypothetical protein [Cytophagales bacterium]